MKNKDIIACGASLYRVLNVAERQRGPPPSAAVTVGD